MNDMNDKHGLKPISAVILIFLAGGLIGLLIFIYNIVKGVWL